MWFETEEKHLGKKQLQKNPGDCSSFSYTYGGETLYLRGTAEPWFLEEWGGGEKQTRQLLHSFLWILLHF